MKDIFIITFLIICCILLVINIIKKHNFLEIDNEIKEKNKKLEIEKTIKTKELEGIEHQLELQKIALKSAEDLTKNINAAAHEAFSQYCDVLEQEYKNVEKEHDDAIDGLRIAYDNLQDSLRTKSELVQKDLDKISATRAAALEAQLKEQEIKNKQSFYCPQVPEADLKDAKTLRDIEYKLNNPRVLRMLI